MCSWEFPQEPTERTRTSERTNAAERHRTVLPEEEASRKTAEEQRNHSEDSLIEINLATDFSPLPPPQFRSFINYFGGWRVEAALTMRWETRERVGVVGGFVGGNGSSAFGQILLR